MFHQHIFLGRERKELPDVKVTFGGVLHDIASLIIIALQLHGVMHRINPRK